MVVDPFSAFSLLGRLPLLTKAWLVLNLVEACLSMPILAVLKMKLASRMTVSINYHCLCLQLTTFSGWQLLLNRQGLIVSTWFIFFFLRQCIPLLTETCTIEVEILLLWLSSKATHSYQAFSAFEIKEFGSESPGFERKGIPDDLWS